MAIYNCRICGEEFNACPAARQRHCSRECYDRQAAVGYLWLIQHVGIEQNECLIWPFSCKSSGYGQTMFNKKIILPHRFMCEQKNGPAPEGYVAAHSCGNRRCVNPGHLSWKTNSGNQLDRADHGTQTKARAKLTPLQAKQIRQLKGVETSILTAARYGVTESNVRLIQEGKTWKAGSTRRQFGLSPSEVRDIRDTSKSAYDLAATYDISISAVYRVRAGLTYRSVA